MPCEGGGRLHASKLKIDLKPAHAKEQTHAKSRRIPWSNTQRAGEDKHRRAGESHRNDSRLPTHAVEKSEKACVTARTSARLGRTRSAQGLVKPDQRRAVCLHSHEEEPSKHLQIAN
eukprot:6191167-Pleurochrysis_carterae.AAC.3